MPTVHHHRSCRVMQLEYFDQTRSAATVGNSPLGVCSSPPVPVVPIRAERSRPPTNGCPRLVTNQDCPREYRLSLLHSVEACPVRGSATDPLVQGRYCSRTPLLLRPAYQRAGVHPISSSDPWRRFSRQSRECS